MGWNILKICGLPMLDGINQIMRKLSRFLAFRIHIVVEVDEDVIQKACNNCRRRGLILTHFGLHISKIFMLLEVIKEEHLGTNFLSVHVSH